MNSRWRIATLCRIQPLGRTIQNCGESREQQPNSTRSDMASLAAIGVIAVTGKSL